LIEQTEAVSNAKSISFTKVLCLSGRTHLKLLLISAFCDRSGQMPVGMSTVPEVIVADIRHSGIGFLVSAIKRI
jgi:hypothetical protein